VEGPILPSYGDRPYLDAPLQYVDVYVDDIIGLAQGDQTARNRVSRAILHSLDSVFRPLDPTDHSTRREPLSEKKSLAGDGYLCTEKEILGWHINGRTMTVHLTERRRQRLQDILDALPRTRSRVSAKQWHKVMGELRSMSLAIPGSRGLFGALQLAFKSGKHRLRLTKVMHDFLDDFRWLVQNLALAPTRVYSLFPTSPIVIGATDASGIGMGGVFFVPYKDHYTSFVWRHPFDATIRTQLCTEDNPNGSITNSDLELAATVMHHDIIAQTVHMAERTVATLHDNVPTVYWHRKGSTTSEGPATYLLRLQSLHARAYHYVPTHDFIPGHLNRMADDASRLTRYSIETLLSHFNNHFPQPTPWGPCTLRYEMLSAVTSALLRTRSQPESWTNAPTPPAVNGTAGWNSVESTPWIPGSKMTTLYRTYKSTLQGTVMDASHPAVNPFDLALLVTPSEILDNRTKPWGPATSVSTPPEPSTSDFDDNSDLMLKETLPLNE